MRILLHLDDVGVSSGSVAAWKALRAAELVTTASVMVPCPWYRAAVEDHQGEPTQDLGVHLTLTSEWSAYRWAPLTGPIPGLVDDEGYFHRRPEAVVAKADPSAVEDEMSAQIERALADGIRPTHLDAHMGTAFLPPFLPKLLDVSNRYDIPILVCRRIEPLLKAVRADGTDPGPYQEMIQETERRGHPVLDRFIIGFCPDNQPIEDHLEGLIASAGDGTHWLALHANAADETLHFAPHMVRPRLKEFNFFKMPSSRRLFEKLGAEPIGWLDLAKS